VVIICRINVSETGFGYSWQDRCGDEVDGILREYHLKRIAQGAIGLVDQSDEATQYKQDVQDKLRPKVHRLMV
jgi:hypothetical protein